MVKGVCLVLSIKKIYDNFHGLQCEVQCAEFQI